MCLSRSDGPILIAAKVLRVVDEEAFAIYGQLNGDLTDLYKRSNKMKSEPDLAMLREMRPRAVVAVTRRQVGMAEDRTAGCWRSRPNSPSRRTPLTPCRPVRARSLFKVGFPSSGVYSTRKFGTSFGVMM